MELGNLVSNYIDVVAVTLFGIGFSLLLFNKNLIKKIMGLNIMDTGIYLFLASMGYIEGKWAPVLNNGSTNPSDYINPIPAGLVLTDTETTIPVNTKPAGIGLI